MKESKLLMEINELKKKNTELVQSIYNLAMNLGQLGNSNVQSACAIDGIIELLAKEFPDKDIEKKLEVIVKRLLDKKKEEFEAQNKANAASETAAE